jgi:hypothetical protein
MDRAIDIMGEKRLVDLLGEECLAADLGERAIGDAVAGRADPAQLDAPRGTSPMLGGAA